MRHSKSTPPAGAPLAASYSKSTPPEILPLLVHCDTWGGRAQHAIDDGRRSVVWAAPAARDGAPWRRDIHCHEKVGEPAEVGVPSVGSRLHAFGEEADTNGGGGGASRV